MIPIRPATGLTHLSLNVADLDRSVAFYERAFGLRILDRSVERIERDRQLVLVHQAILTTPGTHDLLALTQGESVPVGAPGPNHFGIQFATDADVEHAIATALGCGGTLIRRGERQDGGLREVFAYVRDPDGHAIELATQAILARKAASDLAAAADGSARSRTIRFYFDYESPNAYLAWTQLFAVAERHACAVELVPVLYAGLLDAHGHLGPGEIPAKGRWMGKNLGRKAMLLGVPLGQPAFMPFNPLLALRISILPFDVVVRRDVIDALFRAVWVRGLHVSEPPVVEQVLGELGLPGGELIARAQHPDVKEQLRSQTADAAARGAFGVPTMEVGDELFWGYDDFPYLELFLAGRDPIDAASWRTWDEPPRPSSVRKQFR